MFSIHALYCSQLVIIVDRVITRQPGSLGNLSKDWMKLVPVLPAADIVWFWKVSFKIDISWYIGVQFIIIKWWSCIPNLINFLLKIHEHDTCILMIIACVSLSGLNMFQGEIFAYPLHLLYSLVQQGYQLNFVSQDVICKFYPWMTKILSLYPEDASLQKLKDIKPFLGVMHAKTHSWACQVLKYIFIIQWLVYILYYLH